MMDTQKVCRLCASQLCNPRNIFTTPGLLERISRFTDIEIRGYGLPSSICNLCHIQLKMMENFKRQISEADKLIRRMILKQTRGIRCRTKVNERWRTACRKSNLPNNGTSNEWRDHQNRFLHERMRISGRRPSKLSCGVKQRSASCDKPLIYSNENAESLVASYKALINRCLKQGFHDFSLPSSFVDSEDESDHFDERVSRFAAAHYRWHEKCIKQNTSSRKIVNREYATTETICRDTPGLPITDPLNLLRVKSVRPLHENVSDISSSENSSVVNRRLTSRKRGYPKNVQKCSSNGGPSSAIGYLEPFRRHYCSSFSSSSSSSSSEGSGYSVKLNSQRPEKIFRSFSSTSLTRNDTKKCAGSITPVVDNNRSPIAMQCPVCDRICVGQRGLKIHLGIHKSLKCQICDASTLTKERFKDHMQLHITFLDPELVFPCSICKARFRTDTGLNIHMRTHSTTEPVVKTCTQCGRTFGTERGFKIHAAKAHGGIETD